MADENSPLTDDTAAGRSGAQRVTFYTRSPEELKVFLHVELERVAWTTTVRALRQALALAEGGDVDGIRALLAAAEQTLLGIPT